MSKWTGADVTVTVFFTLLYVAIVICGAIGLFAPKNIDYYYGSNGCVCAHWTWHTDEQVICPDDKNKLADEVRRFNESRPKQAQ